MGNEYTHAEAVPGALFCPPQHGQISTPDGNGGEDVVGDDVMFKVQIDREHPPTPCPSARV